MLPSAKTESALLLSVPQPADASLRTAVDKAPASRLDFLRSAGVIATTAAGAAMLPKPSSAEDYTDDVLGFKFQVSAVQGRDKRENGCVPK